MSENRKSIHYNKGALRILEALGAVDEELLERCGTEIEPAESTEKAVEISKYAKSRKPLWKMGRAWAACLGLLAVGFISWNALRLITPKGSSNSNGSASGGSAAQDQNLSADASAAETLNEGESEVTAVTEEASPGEKDDLCEAGGDLTDSGGISRTDSQTGADDEANMQEVQKKLGTSFTVDDFSDSGDDVKSVTEKEARGWVPLGAYIPQNLPNGYRMEGAYINQESQSVTMTWSRGMDYIMISVSSVDPGTVETVDISKPETYDERLYEIPHAETVPREYRESVDNPVFDFSDMDYETGLELMNSRMISYNDAGDTDTPRGRFSILIKDEILLYFNGRGTPEEIWNMLYSMKR